MRLFSTDCGIAREARDGWLEILELDEGDLGALLHPLPRCIEYITRYTKLEPGDVVTTGSPAGVGHRQGLFLKPGDRLELEADRIGTLCNTVVEAASSILTRDERDPQ